MLIFLYMFPKEFSLHPHKINQVCVCVRDIYCHYQLILFLPELRSATLIFPPSRFLENCWRTTSLQR